MRVAVRVDATLGIGTGHVMRCMTLAGKLHARGAAVMFVCREEIASLRSVIENGGFRVARLPACGTGMRWRRDADETREALRMADFHPDLLIVDHYELDASWEQALRPEVERIFVIDDLADRPHDCDMLLDQSLHDAPESRYVGLVGSSTRVFLGPRYALLRPEFDQVGVRLRDGGLQRLLVFFGGTDPSNEALKLLLVMRLLGQQAPLTKLILGPMNPHVQEIRQAAAGLQAVDIIDATARMAELMAEADLAVGTCGGAAWERCAVGLPTLVVVNADNQRDDARLLHSVGAIRNLGDSADTSVEHWMSEIQALRDSPVALQRMSQAAATVMEGRHEAMRELEAVLVH